MANVDKKVVAPSRSKAPDPEFDVCLFLDADDDGVLSSLLCPRCEHVLRDPHILTCSHAFCRPCLAVPGPKVDLICPKCGKAGEVKAADDMRRQVDVQEVRCVHHASGCVEWVGQHGELRKHLQTCEHAIVKCADCKVDIKRSLLAQHQRAECCKRRMSCPICQALHTVDGTDAHLAECQLKKVPCPRGCDAKLQMERRRVAEHMAKDCVLQEIECPFAAKVGCTVKMTRQAMAVHLADPAAVSAHLDGALKKIDDGKTRTDHLTTRLDMLEKKFSAPVSSLAPTVPAASTITVTKPFAPLTETTSTYNVIQPPSQPLFINKLPVPGSVCKGDVIDVLDQERNWCLCVVDDVVGKSRIRVHYLGWNRMYDEWIDMLEQRVQPPYTFLGAPAERIAGGATRCKTPKQDPRASMFAGELDAFLKMAPSDLETGGCLCCKKPTRHRLA